jgi:hypothetical protein
MRYMVHTAEGPKFTSSQEMVNALESTVLPSLDTLVNLEADGTIVGGGVPVGDRALAFIIEADSNDHLDRLLHDLPIWGMLKWSVIPLEPFEARAEQEREFVEATKSRKR